jgi:O-antigen ligase
VILIMLFSLITLGAASPAIYKQFTVREDSASVRIFQYKAAIRMILAHPVFGVGLNNGTAQKPKYVEVTFNPYDPNTQFYREPTHNMYLSMASEIGIFGTLLFFAFFARVALVAWRQSRHSTDPEIRFVANALVVVFCSVAVNGLMDPLHEYSVLVLLWLYAGLSLNLSRMAQGPETMNPSQDHRRR